MIQTNNQQLNNKVLLVGGNSGTATIASVYLFDPVQSSFSTLASLPGAREQHTALTLPGTNGKVLVAGGKNGASVLATAIVFDPTTGPGSWSSAGTMTSARVGHSMTVLPSSIVANGRVLLAGGSSTGSNTLSSAELFSGTSTWTATTAVPAAVKSHAATMLGNGSVLIAGGVNGSATLDSARLYDASFGLSCSSGSQCSTGFCVDGVCCDTACNGGCGACNLPGKVGTCSARSNGTTCRAAAGTCDIAETCDGTALSCPASSFVPPATTCRAAAGTCDVAETCSGSSAACPPDAVAPPTTVCRPAAGACDAPESCTGSSTACPANVLKPAGITCRPSGGSCDVVETCTGGSPACPNDTFLPASTVCRTSAGECDVAESCTGNAPACPTNGFVSPSTICRASTGPNDLAEACTGSTATCPVDGSVQDPTPEPEPGVGEEYHGALTGQLSVSPTGAATYTVPIAIPPGIAGMAPNLSLVYSSQGGDGIAGQGWELAGLSMVHRCPKTRVQDGQGRQVTMSDLALGDGLCIDGRRLFERPGEPGKYDTEMKDFSLITKVADTTFPEPLVNPASGSVSFTVVTKSGETRSYGARVPHNSRVRLTDEWRGFPDPAMGEEIAVWLLDRVTDVWGNYYDIHYNFDQADFVANGIFVTSIDYTGHLFGGGFNEDGTPEQPDIQGTFHTITFGYEDRPDVRHLRFHSQSLPKKKRLTQITTPLGTYALRYEDPDLTLPSRLKKIEYCTAHQPIPPPPAVPLLSCLDPLVFDWDAGDYRWEEMPAFQLPVPIDGVLQNNQTRNIRGTQFADLDGDGRADFIQAIDGTAAGAWLNTGATSGASGQAWQSKPAWALPAKLFKSDGQVAGSRMADMDGDGVLDLISGPTGGTTCQPAPGKGLCVWLNRIKYNLDCAASACWSRADDYGTLPTGWESINFEPTAVKDVVADMNGDGKADLFRYGPGDFQLRVLHNTGSGFAAPQVQYQWPISYGLVRHFHLEDINRDGLADLVANDNASVIETCLGVAINTGANGPNGSVWQSSCVATGSTPDAPPGGRTVGDVDGDGLHDVVWNHVNGARGSLALATGNGNTNLGIDGFLAGMPNAMWGASSFAMADLNSDGLADFIDKKPALLFYGGQLLMNSGSTWVDPGWGMGSDRSSHGSSHADGI